MKGNELSAMEPGGGYDGPYSFLLRESDFGFPAEKIHKGEIF